MTRCRCVETQCRKQCWLTVEAAASRRRAIDAASDGTRSGNKKAGSRVSWAREARTMPTPNREGFDPTRTGPPVPSYRSNTRLAKAVTPTPRSNRVIRQAARIDLSCRHDVAVAFFNDVLDLRRLMPRRYREAIPLGAHALVRRPGHHDAALAPFGLPALALEVKLVIGIGPATGTLAELSDLLIDRPHQRLVSSLTLEPLLHRPSIRRRISSVHPTPRNLAVGHVELCGTAARFHPRDAPLAPRWLSAWQRLAYARCSFAAWLASSDRLLRLVLARRPADPHLPIAGPVRAFDDGRRLRAGGRDGPQRASSTPSGAAFCVSFFISRERRSTREALDANGHASHQRLTQGLRNSVSGASGRHSTESRPLPPA